MTTTTSTHSAWTRTRDIGSYTVYQTPQFIDDGPRVSHVWKGLLEWWDMEPVQAVRLVRALIPVLLILVIVIKHHNVHRPQDLPHHPDKTGRDLTKQALPGFNAVFGDSG